MNLNQEIVYSAVDVKAAGFYIELGLLSLW